MKFLCLFILFYFFSVFLQLRLRYAEYFFLFSHYCFCRHGTVTLSNDCLFIISRRFFAHPFFPIFRRHGPFWAAKHSPNKGANISRLAHWFICYFQLFGKRFREVFWRFLTCFPGSFRSIFRVNFREKIAENPYKPY